MTEFAPIFAINLTGADTLTIDGQKAILDGDNGGLFFRGLFAYSGKMTIENLTIENAVAQGGSGGEGAAGGGGGAGLAAACSSPTIRPAARARPMSRSITFSSPTIRRSGALTGQPGTSAVRAAGAVSAAPAEMGLAAAPAVAASASAIMAVRRSSAAAEIGGRAD